MITAKFILLDFLDWNTIIVLGVIIGIIGQLGDLVESLFKRDAQVKDSSNIIPGHGGIFDRFDSILLTSPVIFLYLTYVK
jgi:phosphatidate cytidylyltransferase